jgi:hypothetical protein
MWAAFLATLVTFTLPWNLAGPNPCSSTGPTMNDLDSVRVTYVISGTTQERVAFAGPVHGQEGQPMTVDIPTTQVATAYVQCKRPWSKWSCVSNFVTVNATLDVGAGGTRVLEYFDAQGRKISPPTKPGLYWKRWRGERIGTVVIVR